MDSRNTEQTLIRASEAKHAIPASLLSLPQEILEAIFDFLFHGEAITVQAKGVLSLFVVKWVVLWTDSLSVLLACRRLHAIAKRCIVSADVSLDLRFQSDFGPPSLDELLSELPRLRTACTTLVLCQNQDISSLRLDLLPKLTSVELHDYKICRDHLRWCAHNLGHNFEHLVPFIMHQVARDQLLDLQNKLPPHVFADLVYICDVIVCLDSFGPSRRFSDGGSRPDSPARPPLTRSASRTVSLPIHDDYDPTNFQNARNSRFLPSRLVCLLPWRAC